MNHDDRMLHYYVRCLQSYARRACDRRTATRWQFSCRSGLASMTFFCLSAAMIGTALRTGEMNSFAVATAIVVFWAGIFNFFGRAALLVGTLFLAVLLSLLLGLAFLKLYDM